MPLLFQIIQGSPVEVVVAVVDMFHEPQTSPSEVVELVAEVQSDAVQ